VGGVWVVAGVGPGSQQKIGSLVKTPPPPPPPPPKGALGNYLYTRVRNP